MWTEFGKIRGYTEDMRIQEKSCAVIKLLGIKYLI